MPRKARPRAEFNKTRLHVGVQTLLETGRSDDLRDRIMAVETDSSQFKILILATISGGYAGADSVGQLHTDYPANVYVLPVVCPAMFPEDFYLRTFERGIDAILVMYSGTDCPYKGGAERTAVIINNVYPRMEVQGIDTRRLRLAAICTVCTKPFLNEVTQMNQLLQEIGPVRAELTAPVPV